MICYSHDTFDTGEELDDQSLFHLALLDCAGLLFQFSRYQHFVCQSDELGCFIAVVVCRYNSTIMVDVQFRRFATLIITVCPSHQHSEERMQGRLGLVGTLLTFSEISPKIFTIEISN